MRTDHREVNHFTIAEHNCAQDKDKNKLKTKIKLYKGKTRPKIRTNKRKEKIKSIKEKTTAVSLKNGCHVDELFFLFLLKKRIGQQIGSVIPS